MNFVVSVLKDKPSLLLAYANFVMITIGEAPTSGDDVMLLYIVLP